MSLKKLELSNFRIFKESTFEFRPITLLTGTNSSGKSSVLNAIASVLQTKDSHLFPFDITVNGENCTLGSFRNIAHGLSTANNFSIGITTSFKNIESKVTGSFRYASRGNQILLDECQFEQENDTLHVKWHGQVNGYKYKYSTDIYEQLDIADKAGSSFKSFSLFMKAMTALRGNKELTQDDINESLDSLLHETSKRSNTWININTSKSNEIEDYLSSELIVSNILNKLRKSISILQANTSYIGPIRSFPARYYSNKDIGIHDDPYGTNAAIVFAEWKKHFPHKYNEVVNILKYLELASNISAKTLKDDIIQIEASPFGHTESVNFADVGFGISQLFPIIIKDLDMNKGGSIIINQPEVHLHPSSQALLANYFSQRSNERQYIIETHSEYILNRFRYLIASKKFDSNKINIIFIDSDAGNNVTNITIGKNGEYINAPDNFFKTYHQDTFNTAMACFEGESN